MKKSTAILALVLISACGPASPVVAPATIRVAYTASAQPWLADLYTCAGRTTIYAEMGPAASIDPSHDMTIRIGLPANPPATTYPIASQEIQVAVSRDLPVSKLTLDQVQGLFSGQLSDWSRIDAALKGKVQVWVFPAGEDVQQVFEQAVLDGTPLTSQARLANTPDEMSHAVAADKNAVGILPGRWITGNVTGVFTAATAPVLVMTSSQPQGAILQILACMSK